MAMSAFDVSLETVVVTSKFVTQGDMPILRVFHENDEEDGVLWQFHCGNGDYDPAHMQLVSLATILKIDPSLVDVAGLPIGYSAVRRAQGAAWSFIQETSE